MNNRDIEYTCKQMLNIEWVPKLSLECLEIISRCDSKLEQMFILGACDFIRRRCETPPTLSNSIVQLNGHKYSGIWFLEPWFGWRLDDLPPEKQSGPSALMFVPQFKSPEKEITHDLAIFYGDDNGSPTWKLKHVVEIDGYGVHQDRRDKDALRDDGLSYKIHRLYEETDKPLEWFKRIIYSDAE